MNIYIYMDEYICIDDNKYIHTCIYIYTYAYT